MVAKAIAEGREGIGSLGGGGVVRCCAPLCVSLLTAARGDRRSARTRGDTDVGVARVTSYVR